MQEQQTHAFQSEIRRKGEIFQQKFIVKFCFLCALGAKKYDFEFGGIGKFFCNLTLYCTLPMY
jgi:hypothetical protein